MKFMNTTKALGVSAIALGFVAGMAHDAAAGDLAGFYKVDQICKVAFNNGLTVGTSKVLYAQVKDEVGSPDFPIQVLMLDKGLARKIAYNGGYQMKPAMSGFPAKYLATLEACEAFERTDQPLGYTETIGLEGTRRSNLASDSVKSNVQSYTTQAITERYCQYLFVRDPAAADKFIGEKIIDCGP